MKILHILTLVTGDGRYGGPQRVALDVAREQHLRGHSVTVAAGGDIQSPPAPEDFELKVFASKQLVPKIGFATTAAPTLLIWLVKHSSEFDIVHVHLSRDLVTLPTALWLRATNIPFVAQTHGMLESPSRRLARLADKIAVAGVLNGARAVMALTESEAADVSRIAPASNVAVLGNGIDIVDSLRRRRDTVTFLARLHPRKGASLFASAAAELTDKHPDVRFIIAGPDEGDLTAVNEVVEARGSTNLETIGAVAPDRVPELLASSLVYVLPAQGEPFGMTVLESMVQGTAVIMHESAELSRTLDGDESGIRAFSGGKAELAAQIDALLSDRDLASTIGQNGRRTAEELFPIKQVVERVMHYYAEL